MAPVNLTCFYIKLTDSTDSLYCHEIAMELGMLMINRLIAIKNLTDNQNVLTDNRQRVFCVLFLQI